MTNLVLREDKDGVAILTLNRPDVLNALDHATIVELREHLDEIARHTDTVRCVLMRGAGRSFCAGADRKSIESREADANPTFKGDTIRLMEALPQPIIVLTHGHCYTGGLEFALGADIIIAAESTLFADTHAKIGHFAGWGLTQRLPRRVGASAARLMSYSSRNVGAAAALAIGLVEMVVPDEGRDEAAFEVAKEIALRPAASVQWTKRMITGGMDLPLAEALNYETFHHPNEPLRNTAKPLGTRM